MMRRWVKWLIPYGFLSRFIRKFTSDLVDVEGMRCKMWRIDYGEYILIDVKSELTQRKKKLESELREIEEKLGDEE